MLIHFCINSFTSQHTIPEEQAHGYFATKTTWQEYKDGETKQLVLFQIQKMFGKPIQPIGLADSATLEEHYCMFFHSSTNALLSYVTLPVQIMFIRFDSNDSKEENIGKWDSKTKTRLLQDIDVIICFQAQYHIGRATIQSKILVKVDLQVSAKLESEVQVKTISQFHSYSHLSGILILYLCLSFLGVIKEQSLFHPSRYFFGYLVQTNMKLKIQVKMTSPCTTMESKFTSTIRTIHQFCLSRIQTIHQLCLSMGLLTILRSSSNADPLSLRFLVILLNMFSSYNPFQGFGVPAHL